MRSWLTLGGVRSIGDVSTGPLSHYVSGLRVNRWQH